MREVNRSVKWNQLQWQEMNVGIAGCRDPPDYFIKERLESAKGHQRRDGIFVGEII